MPRERLLINLSILFVMLLSLTVSIPIAAASSAHQSQSKILAIDPTWSYRRPVTISNSSGSTFTDYQVQIILDSDFDFNRADPDGNDIRVTDTDGLTEIPFWIETWDPGSLHASIWTKVPSLPPGDTTIYLYYGKVNATSASNGTDTFIFFDSFENFNDVGMNAPSYLTTPTYDSTGQVVHPDIVHVPGGWNGYEYWMAMTPYPNGNPATENPSIIVSNDGLTWVEPAGITNPLVGGGSNADPDMVLVDGVMNLFYVNADTTNTYLYRMTSTDGINWTTPTIVLTMARYLLSPAVLYEDGTYYLWYVRNAGCSAASSSMYLRTSADGITWGTEHAVTASIPGQVLWHPDIVKVDDTYVMLVAAYPDTSDCGYTSLYYAESSDRTTWNVTTDPILAPTASEWDSAEIYRSSFLMTDTFIRIWYSARNASSLWYVGYTEGELDDFFATNEQIWDVINGNVSATTDHPHNGVYGLRQVGGSTYPQVRKNITGRFSYNAWLFDDLSTAGLHLAIQRVLDQISPVHPIGVGFYTGTSTGFYSYHTAGFSYSATIVPRTVGWHKLTINIKASTCDLFVDDSLVASLSDLDESNIQQISLEGYQGGVSYFDDAYIRQYNDPEPTTSVGMEGPTAVVLPIFIAESQGDTVLLKWQTTSEIDLVGFNIYRSDGSNLSQVTLNTNIIEALSPGSVLGNVYSYQDTLVEMGKEYRYWLELVTGSGTKTIGPATIKASYLIYTPMLIR